VPLQRVAGRLPSHPTYRPPIASGRSHKETTLAIGRATTPGLLVKLNDARA
jgi:hypothetical protein